MKTLIMLLGLTLIAGCCTKKMCVGDELPEIIVHIQDPNTYEVTVYAADRITNELKDSALAYGSMFLINTRMFGNISSFANYNYIISTQSGISDTVRNVSYTVHTETIECNECVGKIDYQDITLYSNFSYQHEGLTYNENDSLVIN